MRGGSVGARHIPVLHQICTLISGFQQYHGIEPIQLAGFNSETAFALVSLWRGIDGQPGCSGF